MQSEVPTQSFVWGVLAARFQSELTLQKSEIWRLSGLLEEYGSAADDFNREREQKAIIEELAGFLVQAVAQEALDREFANGSGRRAGRPPAARPGEAAAPAAAEPGPRSDSAEWRPATAGRRTVGMAAPGLYAARLDNATSLLVNCARRGTAWHSASDSESRHVTTD